MPVDFLKAGTDFIADQNALRNRALDQSQGSQNALLNLMAGDITNERAIASAKAKAGADVNLANIGNLGKRNVELIKQGISFPELGTDIGSALTGSRETAERDSALKAVASVLAQAAPKGPFTVDQVRSPETELNLNPSDNSGAIRLLPALISLLDKQTTTGKTTTGLVKGGKQEESTSTETKVGGGPLAQIIKQMLPATAAPVTAPTPEPAPVTPTPEPTVTNTNAAFIASLSTEQQAQATALLTAAEKAISDAGQSTPVTLVSNSKGQIGIRIGNSKPMFMGQ